MDRQEDLTSSTSPTRRELLAATAAAGGVAVIPAALCAAAAASEAIRPSVSLERSDLDDPRRRVAATAFRAIRAQL